MCNEITTVFMNKLVNTSKCSQILFLDSCNLHKQKHFGVFNNF